MAEVSAIRGAMSSVDIKLTVDRTVAKINYETEC